MLLGVYHLELYWKEIERQQNNTTFVYEFRVKETKYSLSNDDILSLVKPCHLYFGSFLFIYPKIKKPTLIENTERAPSKGGEAPSQQQF